MRTLSNEFITKGIYKQIKELYNIFNVFTPSIDPLFFVFYVIENTRKTSVLTFYPFAGRISPT